MIALDRAKTELNQLVLIPNIIWQTYQSLKRDLGDRSGIRLSYCLGLLWIKMPSKIHEIINRLLTRMVSVLTEELDLEIVDMGSTTLDREDLARGVEPDTCFYIQNARQVEGLNPQIPINLPPDSIVEVDISSPSNQCMEIYQQLGISEVWCYAPNQGLRIYHLQAQYEIAAYSLTFPILTAAKVNQVLSDRQTKTENSVIYDFRQCIKAEAG